MKKILLFGVLGLVIIGLHAHGACVLENIKNKEACTGGASGLDNRAQISDLNAINEKSMDKQNLENTYQIPNLSIPSSRKNGFPILNPSSNCMFGMCQPK